MRVLRRILFVMMVVILVLGIGGIVIYFDVLRGMLPQHRGVLDVPGLRAEVEVLRDDYGVPHLYGSNIHDLYFAQGYVQAQDRWWQMAFSRAIGSGRIQELIGENDAAFGQDVFIHTVGWRQLAERDFAAISPEAQALLQAFADGVNAYIGSRAPGDLAVEYTLLGLNGISFEIEPWTPIDSLAWGRALSWNLSSSYSEDLERAVLSETLGADMANAYFPPYDYVNKPTILTPADLPLTPDSLRPAPLIQTRSVDTAVPTSLLMAGGVRDVRPLGEGDSLGSNSWVVSAAHTEDHLPMLANDVHLSITLPAIFYEIGLHCLPLNERCPLDVVGFALPATPTLIIGRNQQIAWGLTTGYLDVQDVYRLNINPDNPLQYEWNGEWRDMTVREETLAFGDGAPPITFQVRETHLGVIINDNQRDPETGALTGFNTTDPVVLHWDGNLASHLAESLIRLNLAQDWGQFRDALSLWDLPSHNVVYADAAGNIGYQLTGRAPVRPEGSSGALPVLATSDADVWQGFIPYDQMPRILNPERGYIVTANNAQVPLAYYAQIEAAVGEAGEYQLSDSYPRGDRAQRIITMLDTPNLHSFDSFQRMQMDNVSLMAQTVIVPYLAQLAIPDDQTAVRETRDFLTNWDFTLNANSAQAAVFGYLSNHLIHETFDDQLPEDIEVNTSKLKSIMYLLADAEHAWWDDVRTTGSTETRDDILLRALTLAVREIAAEQGNNPAEWAWGTRHQAYFVNQPLGLSGIDLIEGFVNRGPYAASGGYSVVNAQSWELDTMQVNAIPTLRTIVNFADPDRSFSVIAGGQSGHPTSDRYFDQYELWQAGALHRQHFTRGSVELNTQDRLLLRPAG